MRVLLFNLIAFPFIALLTSLLEDNILLDESISIILTPFLISLSLILISGSVCPIPPTSKVSLAVFSDFSAAVFP